MQQKKEPVQDDSDLDRKRRETEALLQSIGISPEPPLGILPFLFYYPLSRTCVDRPCPALLCF